MIGGGRFNYVSNQYATIGGGLSDTATGQAATIAGGEGNKAIGGASAIGGGYQNYATGSLSVVAGGFQNRDSADQAGIVSGFTNRIGPTGARAFIGAGLGNRAGGPQSVIGGGATNQTGDTSDNAVIGGGANNVARGQHSTIGGGYISLTTGNYSTVAGGISNFAAGHGSFIGGGGPSAAGGQFSTIGGGANNLASGNYTTIAGGHWNDIAPLGQFGVVSGGHANRSNGAYSVISGGDSNQLQLADYSIILGGRSNYSSGLYTTIAGGQRLSVGGNNVFAFLANPNDLLPMGISNSNVAAFGNVDLWLANNRGQAGRLFFYEPNSVTGGFPPVLSASQHYSTFEAQTQIENYEYLLPASAPTALPANHHVLAITGVSTSGIISDLTLSWVDNTLLTSDKRRKENITLLKGEPLLAKFHDLELSSWNYIGDKQRHYGVMAQDFYSAFGNDGVAQIGTDTTLSVIDLHGVAYLAIQGLEHRTANTNDRLKKLEQENAALRQELEALKEAVKAINGEGRAATAAPAIER